MSVSRSVILYITCWLLLACGPRLSGASISSFSPTLGSHSDPNPVFIFGTGFSPGTLVVKFNGVVDPTAGATAADGTIIQAQVPVGATTGPISVQVNGGPIASS